MKWRLHILHLVMALVTFLGANSFATKESGAGSVIPHFENSHSRLLRNHRNQSHYTEDHSQTHDVDLDLGLSGDVAVFVPIPVSTYMQTAYGKKLPPWPAVAEKRFLVLRAILI